MSDVALEDVVCTRCKSGIEVLMSELFLGDPVTCPSCGHQQDLSAPPPSSSSRRTLPPSMVR